MTNIVLVLNDAYSLRSRIMNLTRTLSACAAICLSLLTAHAQFQVVHNAPNTTSTPQLIPLLLADGSTVTFHGEAGQDVFRKYDGNGALVWTKALAGASLALWNGGPGIAMMNDGADGFRFARLSGVNHVETDSLPFEDLFTDSMQVVHVNANGDVTGAFAVKKTFYGDWGTVNSDFQELDVARTPDNGMVLAITYRGLGFGSIDVIKLDAGGTMEWNRNVGMYYGGGPDGTSPYNPEAQARVAVSATGRIYYTEASTYPYSNLRLAELGSNGDLLWMKRYVYGNTNPFISFNDIQTDDAGNIHAAGFLTSSVGHFHIFLRTDADGVLDRGDIYRTPLGLFTGQFGLDAQGRRYHFVNTTDLLTNATSQGILIADTLGSPARFIRRDDQVDLPNNVLLMPYGMDVAGDRLALSGLLNHEDVNLAYTTRYEMLTSIGTDSIFSCLMDDTTFVDIPVPMNIMTTEVITDAASIDVSAYYSIEPLALSFTSVTPDPLEPLCTFAGILLQGGLGVDEGGPAPRSPLVLNSLVAQGTPLFLNDPDANAVDIYDIYGSLVQHSTLGGSRTVSTTGWSTGVYVVRAMDRSGSPFRTARIVVE